MARNFEFMLSADNDFSDGMLKQGDVLEKTAALAAIVGEAHSYYSDAEDYEYFLVLTPTCDLVLRSGKCKSRYITLAAIRPLKTYVERQLAAFKTSAKAPGLFLSQERRILAEQFVTRLLHNTEKSHIFLPGEFFPDGVDRCAFLHLSVALRQTHYTGCLAAKKLQLADSFSALVGSAASDLYGQIATPAIEEQSDVNHKEIVNEYLSKILDGENYHWLTAERLREFKKRLTPVKEAKGDGILPSDVAEIVSGLPDDQKLLASQIRNIIQDSVAKRNLDMTSETDLQLLENIISSDTSVRRFLANKSVAKS